MSKTVYSYDRDTGKYIGVVNARESPLDKKQGRQVYMIPADCTEVEPPSSLEDHQTLWDGKQWTQKKIEKIAKTVTRQLSSLTFEEEVKVAFPGIKIEMVGDVNSKTARTLVFKNIPDTLENRSKLDAVISAHVLPGSKVEHLGDANLAALEVLFEEIAKIKPEIGDFASFKQKVNQKLAATIEEKAQ